MAADDSPEIFPGRTLLTRPNHDYLPQETPMDAFESLVVSLLERQGFWVRPSVRVELTKEEKRKIDRPSSPRWELDLIAYKGATNELRIIECKSYLDSRGVSISAFDGSDERFASRFKLFNESRLRKVVLRRLVSQLRAQSAIASRPKITLCLAAGKVASKSDRQLLQQHFKKNRWQLWDDEWLCAALRRIADGSYENDIADVVAKIILRSKKAGRGGASALCTKRRRTVTPG